MGLGFGDNDGSINISVSGGTGNYSYEWSVSGVDFADSGLVQGQQDQTGLSPGVYQLILSDSCTTIQKVYTISTPDLLIANAGIGINGSVGKNTSRDIQDATYLMFGGVINLIEHFLPKMKEKDSGRVVIISSIGALIPMPKSSIYAAVKSGIYSYGRSLNEELENTNVSVTVSLPGYVRTNIHKRSGLEHLTKKIPNWMWISADKVVDDTEKASRKGKSHIIPGFLYRITSIFFNLKITKIIWKTLNARK